MTKKNPNVTGHSAPLLKLKICIVHTILELVSVILFRPGLRCGQSVRMVGSVHFIISKPATPRCTEGTPIRRCMGSNFRRSRTTHRGAASRARPQGVPRTRPGCWWNRRRSRDHQTLVHKRSDHTRVMASSKAGRTWPFGFCSAGQNITMHQFQDRMHRHGPAVGRNAFGSGSHGIVPSISPPHERDARTRRRKHKAEISEGADESDSVWVAGCFSNNKLRSWS